jgi:hypothetical protein
MGDRHRRRPRRDGGREPRRDEAGGQSIGLNIVLPHEQAPNAYVTPDLAFNFHYFAIRKMHFLMRARRSASSPAASARWTSCSKA